MPTHSIVHRAVAFTRRARRFAKSRRGSIAPLVALLIVPLVAIMGIATEGGGWFLIQRAGQNAADSAVIAAATNNGNGGTDYATEAKSITGKYGFTDGTNHVVVSVPAAKKYPSVSPCASATCYNVTITKKVPLYLMQLIGFSGDTTVDGDPGQTVQAAAYAKAVPVNAPFCVTALGSGGITTHGSPKSTLTCNIQSVGDATCSGHPFTAGYSDTAGKSKNDCGTAQHTNTTVTDPYAKLASSIPPVGSNCTGGFFPEGYSGSKGTWPAKNNIAASFTMPSVSYYCGDVKVSGGGGNPIVITPAAGGSVMVIENGSLDVKSGATLQASGLTIIFAGAGTGSTYDQYTDCSAKKCSLLVDNGPVGPGNLDISSPTSGTWSGMIMYQDPNVPGGTAQNIDFSGNSPGWKLSGIVYLPKTNFTLDGAVGKSSAGYACFTLVVSQLLVNGTGNMFDTTSQAQCALQGVSNPTNTAYVIGQLVY